MFLLYKHETSIMQSDLSAKFNFNYNRCFLIINIFSSQIIALCGFPKKIFTFTFKRK